MPSVAILAQAILRFKRWIAPPPCISYDMNATQIIDADSAKVAYHTRQSQKQLNGQCEASHIHVFTVADHLLRVLGQALAGTLDRREAEVPLMVDASHI